jgi:hypothetical protein
VTFNIDINIERELHEGTFNETLLIIPTVIKSTIINSLDKIINQNNNIDIFLKKVQFFFQLSLK